MILLPPAMADQDAHHILVSPVSASSTATSLAATLTPGTPTALDEQKHVLSLSSINLSSSSPASITTTATATGAAGPPSTSSESSDSSLLSSLDDYDDDDESDYDYYNDNDECDYGTEMRHQRAKRAARILLAQCLLEDNPRYYSEDSFSRSGRLGLAPVTLLLNPETPCPTKIIPLPTTSSSGTSNSSSNSTSYACSSSSYSSSLDDTDEDDQERQEIQEAQQASLFIRLL